MNSSHVSTLKARQVNLDPPHRNVLGIEWPMEIQILSKSNTHHWNDTRADENPFANNVQDSQCSTIEHSFASFELAPDHNPLGLALQA